MTPGTRSTEPSLRETAERIAPRAAEIRLGGGADAIRRQHEKGRLTARERIAALIDPETDFLELGLWAGEGLYDSWGGAPGAGVITGIGSIRGRDVAIVANDATVKAGAAFPMTIKKMLRMQTIAFQNRLPVVYLVDSSGVFLPLQDEVFPDEDDFGRIFRNNAVLSAQGIPQIAAIMGNCVAGGAYLPVLCDTVLMTEGSGLYLAGPALVKAAIGQEVSSEELGGAAMHAAVSGTIDYHEPTDDACLTRIRQLVGLLQLPPAGQAARPVDPPSHPASDLYDIVQSDPSAQYDVRDVFLSLFDAGAFDEYREDYGKTLVCGFARLQGVRLGVVANQRLRFKPQSGGAYQFGGVIYGDSADKAARFVLDCNQAGVPILFLQDVNGFDVGRDAERSGIIRRGAKLVNAVSNSTVPKITLLMGHSFGAGHYALCGRAFDPRFLFAWPSARYAVMGASQAAKTLTDVRLAALKRQGQAIDEEEMERISTSTREGYEQQTDIRYAAARGWVDEIIAPEETREILGRVLKIVTNRPLPSSIATGVFQV